MSRTYEVDCRQVQTYDDFVEAFNRTFIRTFGGQWNGNLDAFNDYLSWPEDVPYQRVIHGSARCARALDLKVNASHESVLWEMLQEVFASNKEWAHVLYK